MLYLNDHLSDFDLSQALALLSPQRREQALRYRHELGQRTCAAAYLLLCEGLRAEYGMEQLPLFEYGEHGKPSIVGRPDIGFSLSHCSEAAACLLGRGPVGVDVESVRPLREALVRYTMSADEQQLIFESVRPDVAFTRLWTQKEAVLKMRGTGINNELKTVLQHTDGLRIDTVESADGRYVYSTCIEEE